MAVIGAILGLRKLLANDERVRPQTTAYADLDAAVAERVFRRCGRRPARNKEASRAPRLHVCSTAADG
ncbi:unnamed protein product [Mycetohabitans rhizoxinica HKI 454]|uniref:Uncharacterized protein n=1 Tax=Mycetohabitans rhizoxinica (strain DSM 19002 / CIP 109453 / HKI 454) TaxID=882378 RepID=E5ARV7_MYCRK|nr:unnamed protein product [Mycetohabitans rhizoxinica HKI 454]